MAGSIHGATIPQARCTRTMEKLDRTTMEHWRRWGLWKMARVPMASMTWLETCGNGSAIGMTMTTTKKARRKTRQGRQWAGSKCSVAARGPAVRGICGRRIVTGIRRRSGAYTSPDSAVQRIRNFLLAIRGGRQSCHQTGRGAGGQRERALFPTVSYTSLVSRLKIGDGSRCFQE